MKAVRVVLFHATSEESIGRLSIGDQGLAALLKKSPSIDLVEVVNKTELEDVLLRGNFNVLILPAGAKTEADYQRYLATRPDIGILVIDLAGPETIVRFRDADGELLVRVIRTLSQNRAARVEDCARIRWLSSKDFDPLAHAREDNGKPYPNARAHLTDVKRWSALVLLRLLSTEDVNANGSSITGWTIGQDEARNLLIEVAGELADCAKPEVFWCHMQERERASLDNGVELPLRRIAEAFKLKEVEEKLLWHALGPELDGRFARIYGYLNDDLTRGRPTLTRLARLLEAEAQPVEPKQPAEPKPDAWGLREMLAGPRPFARHHLISVHMDRPHGMPATVESVAPAPELVRFLFDHVNEAESCETGAAFLFPDKAEDSAPGYDRESALLVEDLRRAIVDDDGPIFRLKSGREAQHWFERVVGSAGMALLRVSLALQEDLSPVGLARAAEGWARLARLHETVLLITGFEQQDNATRLKLSRICVDCLVGLVPALVLHGASLDSAGTGDRAVRLIEHMDLTIHVRAEIWHQRASHAGLHLSRTAALELAAIARFDEAQIDMAICIAKGLAQDRAEDHAPALCEAVRRMARDAAPSAVQVVECTYGWSDIVLRPDVLEQIKSIPDQVRFGGLVREDWGFDKRMPYGRGVAALFSGASGTGKSMAAQILASDLCTVLYRIDLSKTVSKWLGETEKILSQIFDLAQQNSAVLFFDEADVLFAKRTEVKDAHDRYANVEVAYLLQRMEDYDGLAILTTNLKQNIDPAFLRRLRFVVDFPMPDAEQRAKIWKQAFPKTAPLADDVDFEFLARRLTLTGGSIQQIAIRAAFAAAADNPKEPVITMQHIVRATRQELLKLGMLGAEQTLAEMAIDAGPPRQEARA
ncbi:hypothetical protein ABIF69_004523 [Bradyrhizobium japonicum]